MAMNNPVFWDVTPCGFCENERFGGKYRIHHQGDNRVLRFHFTPNFVPCSHIFVTLMMEMILSSET
jgi:hypothetical protein